MSAEEKPSPPVGEPAVIQPRVLKGFRDYLPAEMQPRQRMIRTIVGVFERFGFSPLQTPALEYSDILLGKYGADAEKLLFRFTDNGGRDVCLRYDLTIPLARVAAQYRDLPKPFKRYQVAPVWRAEKPGKGRFREFSQCDVDVVGSSSLVHDAECVAVDAAVMSALEVGGFEVRVSNRKILGALGDAVGLEGGDQLAAVFRTIDKLPSQGEERVRGLLESDAGCSPQQIDRVMEFLGLSGSNEELLAGAARVLGASAEDAVGELETVLAHARALGVPDDVVTLDFSIARGLDYYTGTVFETFLTALPEIGSVMSGGRYDDLITRFLGKPMPAVGISVGVDRLFAALKELDLVDPRAGRGAPVIAVAYDAGYVPECLRVVGELRSAGVAADILLDDDEAVSMKRQMKAANRRGAALCVIIGPQEVESGVVMLRDMAAGEQEAVPRGGVVGAVRERLG